MNLKIKRSSHLRQMEDALSTQTSRSTKTASVRASPILRNKTLRASYPRTRRTAGFKSLNMIKMCSLKASQCRRALLDIIINCQIWKVKIDNHYNNKNTSPNQIMKSLLPSLSEILIIWVESIIIMDMLSIIMLTSLHSSTSHRIARVWEISLILKILKIQPRLLLSFLEGQKIKMSQCLTVKITRMIFSIITLLQMF